MICDTCEAFYETYNNIFGHAVFGKKKNTY